jgi:spore coat protein A, manganese oxidase
MVTRRRFLQAGALLGAGSMLPWHTTSLPTLHAAPRRPAILTKFVDPLPIPPAWTSAQLAANGLVMATARHRFHRDLPETPTWGYGGATYLGPTIDAQRGTPVSFTARNRLGPHPLSIDTSLHGPNLPGVNDQTNPRVSLHLHGGYVEPQFDGYPEDTFVPGQEHLYTYPNDQQSGTIWYHDHALGITRLNVYAGLAGFYLVRDPVTEAGLPVGAPYEIPLAIQDKSFNADGTLFYPSPWEPEFFGDVAVVNGKAWPTHEVARGWYRLRLLNGSSSRVYHLRFSPSVPMYQIGSDTGMLNAPMKLSSIILAPGERADVMVDFSKVAAGKQIILENRKLPRFVVSPETVAIREIMRFVVTRYTGFQWALPKKPRPGNPVLQPGPGIRQRNLTLVEIMDMTTGAPMMALLNNRHWDTDEIERPSVGTVEQWNLINLTMDTHPIHLHLVQFQILNRQSFDAARYLWDVYGTDMLHHHLVGTGAMPYPSPDGYLKGKPITPDTYEGGWKDTIQAHPGMVTRILVPFGPNAAPGVPFGQNHRANPITGRYVWHCHILDHEDNEMMLPYEVVP